MHNNYYFLKVLTRQLRKELVGSKVGEIFSQSKNELILSFYTDNSQSFLKAHLSPQFCCLSFPDNFSRAKRNSVDLFQEVIDLIILDITQIENDRSFCLVLDKEYSLLFKMHGNRSNIILFKGQKIHGIFKSNLKQDSNIEIRGLNKTLDLNQKRFEQLEGDHRKITPTLGKAFQPYFTSVNYDQSSIEVKYKILNELLEYLGKPELFIHYDADGLPQLSLLKINEIDISYSSAKKTLNDFFSQYISLYTMLKEKSSLRNSINEQIKKADSYIKKTTDRLHQIKHRTSYQQLGDLIMANLHHIQPFTLECTLSDFYTQKEIKIPLKAKLTPQLNAENYYRKAKRQKIEVESLSKNIEAKKESRDQLLVDLKILEHTSDLRKYQKKTAAKTKITEPAYHSIDILGFQVMIGKSAPKNDLLTFKIAKKDDLFLHAKDTSGSHVIIRKKDKQNFPKSVVEQAASISAFYSKSKSESLCRVLYTPRKYVRKAKGGPAGSVIVEREQVILVAPKSIADTLKN